VVRSIYQALSAEARAPFILDIDPRTTPEQSGVLLGVTAYAKRNRSTPLYCLDRGWGIAHSKGARCTERDLRDRRRVVAARDLGAYGVCQTRG
jgi:hypothetical protein